MRFLIDTQLPLALAGLLRTHDHQAEHVLELGMGQSSDRQLWEYACANRAVIVTKDEDFVERKHRAMDGAPVLWIRVGNCSNRALLESLTALLPSVLEHFEQGEGLVEIR